MGHHAPFQIVDHRHVVVALPKRRLVHADQPGRLQLPAGQAPFHGPALNVRRLIPAQAQTARHRGNARLTQPFDGLRLEQRGEPRTRVRPRHLQLKNAVLHATHPRHLRVNARLVLHRVQVAPTAMPGVVSRTRLAALRTPCLPVMLDMDLHRAPNHRTTATRMRLVHPKRHLPHPPRPLDPQQLLERPSTLHAASLRPDPHPTLPASRPHRTLKTSVCLRVQRQPARLRIMDRFAHAGMSNVWSDMPANPEVAPQVAGDSR